MAVLIVSDSHRLKNELNQLVNRHQNEVAMYIHCGDSELKKDDYTLAAFEKVGGNCDFFSKMPSELVIHADDMNIFVTHGHLFNVKSSRRMLQAQTSRKGCEVACYGHSHQRKAEMLKGVLLINPGSISQPRGPLEKTYAILNKIDQKYLVDFYDLEGNLIEHLEFGQHA